MTVNVSDYVRSSAARYPDAPALIADDRRLTWAELDARVDEFASGLASLGLVAGHRVAFALLNSLEAAITYFATVRGGYVAVPINPALTQAQLQQIVDETKPRVVFADLSSVDRLRPVIGDAAFVVVGALPETGELTLDELIGRASGSVPPSPPDPESLALVSYTANSSGRLRGAMLTHRALIANIEQVGALEVPLIDADDRVLCVLPLYHIFALNAIIGQAARQGAAVYLVRRFDPESALQLIAGEQITVVPLAPPVIAAWAGREDLADAFASVRTVVSGAAVLDPDLQVEFELSAGVAVEQGYGMTEAAPVVATTVGLNRPDGPPQRGAVGRALPGIEIRSVEGGVESESDDAGELWFRGDNLFSGYWPDGSDGPDAEGWYHSGDVGFVDEAGNVVVIERATEVVRVSGFKVFSFEVEEVLGDVDGVAAAAVVGVPDEATGEAVRAFIVPADGADPVALRTAVLQAAQERLAPYKVPAEIVVVENLPYSTSGKVEKGRLRAMARSDVLGFS